MPKLFSILTMLLLISCMTNKRINYTVLGLGDSITEGKGDNKSYLLPLKHKLDSAGYAIEFIGPNAHQSDSAYIMNAGFSGKNAEYLDTQIDSIYSLYTADIVLLHAGHNHFASENPIEGIIAAHKSIILKITKINPRVKIFVAQVIPAGKLPKYSYSPELNEQIQLLIAQMKSQGLPVTLVDQSKDFNWETHCLPDKVHPNDKGSALMATEWFLAIDQKLKNAQ